jgi:xanthine/CO dehydrogenase XdhC/CoxF family maturation factor
MDMISLNTTFGGDVTENQEIDYSVEIPKEGTYVLDCGGKAQVSVEVWEDQETIFCMSGVGQRAAVGLKKGPSKIKLKAVTGGSFTFLVRPWKFSDNLGL